MTGQGFSDLWARSSDGLRLHTRLYGQDGAGVSNIVCLPGLARHAADFHEVALALTDPAGPRRRVIAIDYRGRGLSEHDPDPSRYTVPVETNDVLGLLDGLGIRRAVFIGSSRGGLVTVAAAAARPGLVRAALLNDIGPVIERAGLLRIKGYVGKIAAPRDLRDGAERLRNLFGPQFPTLSESDWLLWARRTWVEHDGRLVLAYDPALARTLDPIGPDTDLPVLWTAFEALRDVPVLVVRGAHSDLLSAATVERMGEVHPDLQAVTVPDQGHTPFLESSGILPVVRRFIERFDVAD